MTKVLSRIQPTSPDGRTGAGAVRLIGGQWKRSQLPVLDLPGLRPTPDRVRQTLFNWLGQDLSGWCCVDVFAGTGALGFEAASRGATQVLLCEQSHLLVRQLRITQVKLKAEMCEIRCTDGLAALAQLSPASMDLILLDPPFDSAYFEAALRASARAVKADGFVYLEAPIRWLPQALTALGLNGVRYLKAGAVHAHLLQSQAIQTA